jgi:hypothetical protein
VALELRDEVRHVVVRHVRDRLAEVSARRDPRFQVPAVGVERGLLELALLVEPTLGERGERFSGDGDPVAAFLRDRDLGQLRLRLLLRRACAEELAPLDAGAVSVAEAVAALPAASTR